MKKCYVNRRLLEYKLDSFNYSKINNNHYFNRKRNKLLLNYYWNKTKNLENTIKFSKKLSDKNWFSALKDLNLLDIIFQKYQTANKEIIWNKINNNECLECGKIINKSRTFCSNKCSNNNKAKDKNYIKKLSSSIKTYHFNTNETEKKKKYEKISKGVKKFNSSLNSEQRKEKYSNKNKKLFAYDSFVKKFNNLSIKFSEKFFYENRYLPVKCKSCGFEWEMTKSTTLARTECKKCNPYKKHKTQTRIFNYVNSLYKTKENAKNVISNEIDIYCKELNFGIEYNGLLPHSYGPSKIHFYSSTRDAIDKNYHLRKTEECEDKNIQLFHIFENEYLNTTKRKIWYSVINSKLNLNERIYARKCIIKEICADESRLFLEQNHLQGSCNSSVKVGLYYKELLISVMTFRKHKQYQWEIARFANSLNISTVGGASKLLKFFERNYKPESIISYANRRWSQGNLYEKLGFEFTHNTAPNYFYFKINENILYSREQFQKHKLKDKLETFNPELSEIENMFNNGYRIIYDSGNKAFIKKFINI